MDYEKMSMQELRKIAKDLNVNTKLKKAELINEIKKNQEVNINENDDPQKEENDKDISEEQNVYKNKQKEYTEEEKKDRDRLLVTSKDDGPITELIPNQLERAKKANITPDSLNKRADFANMTEEEKIIARKKRFGTYKKEE